ncbi:kinase-like domain-containing protein [Phascolomyces articulosus]|uniref:Kinase-like domain-containing protein n=1 Tax=Phascolomyces articulosus TaxID=60185 RepID=A0AAD5PEL5_9FUNG|nr:kinase-like domain-containing protein [Phascolomyces articulosus]
MKTFTIVVSQITATVSNDQQLLQQEEEQQEPVRWLLNRHVESSLFVQVLNVVVETDTHVLSLVRYVPDLVEFDHLIKTHYRRVKIPFPKLTEESTSSGTAASSSTSADKRRSFRQFLNSLPHGGHHRSNAEKIERYLHKCSLEPVVRSSSIFRDFFSVQRDEDRCILKTELKKQQAQSSPPVPSIPPHQQQRPHQIKRKQVQLPPERPLSPPPATPPPLISTPVVVVDAKRKNDNYNNDNDKLNHTTIHHSSNNNKNNQINNNNISEQDQQEEEDAVVPQSPIQNEPLLIEDDDEEDDEIQSHHLQPQHNNEINEPDMPKKYNFFENLEMIKVLGKGCMGKVFLVRSRTSHELYALKSIVKELVIEQREITHTLAERDILATLSGMDHPFLAKLHASFQDMHRLYLVTDYYCGGDLATQMSTCSTFSKERTLFYAAEIIDGMGELHRLGVLYRDLKPENILLTADGHVLLTDFGLSKWLMTLTQDDDEQQPLEERVTQTFCGTAEYLAPEALLGEPYSFGIDHWAYGTILYEMLAGITPFWADNHSEMYRRVLQDPLEFPPDTDFETAEFLSALLERDPRLRLGYHGVGEIKQHMYFSGIDWEDVYHRRLIPPYVPDLRSSLDFSNFDPSFLEMPAVLTPIPSTVDLSEDIQQVFDGYSFIDTRFIEEEEEQYFQLQQQQRVLSDEPEQLVPSASSPTLPQQVQPLDGTTSPTPISTTTDDVLKNNTVQHHHAGRDSSSSGWDDELSVDHKRRTMDRIDEQQLKERELYNDFYPTFQPARKRGSVSMLSDIDSFHLDDHRATPQQQQQHHPYPPSSHQPQPSHSYYDPQLQHPHRHHASPSPIDPSSQQTSYQQQPKKQEKHEKHEDKARYAKRRNTNGSMLDEVAYAYRQQMSESLVVAEPLLTPSSSSITPHHHHGRVVPELSVASTADEMEDLDFAGISTDLDLKLSFSLQLDPSSAAGGTHHASPQKKSKTPSSSSSLRRKAARRFLGPLLKF